MRGNSRLTENLLNSHKRLLDGGRLDMGGDSGKKYTCAGLLHATRSCHLVHIHGTAMRMALSLERPAQRNKKKLLCKWVRGEATLHTVEPQ